MDPSGYTCADDIIAEGRLWLEIGGGVATVGVGSAIICPGVAPIAGPIGAGGAVVGAIGRAVVGVGWIGKGIEWLVGEIGDHIPAGGGGDSGGRVAVGGASPSVRERGFAW